MTLQPPAADELLTPAGVAALLFVDPKTVTRWARAGKLDAILTPGGHRRYLRSDVLAIMSGKHHSQHLVPGPSFSPMFETVPAPRAAPRDQQDPEPAATPLAHDAEVLRADQYAAAALVADAVAVAIETDADEAAAAVIVTAAAVAAAAEKAAQAATRAAGARAVAASRAAQAVADNAVRTAELVELQAAATARQVADAAAHAAELITLAETVGTPSDAARTAGRIADTVEATAEATAQDTARAAASVANAVASAASQMESLVSALDVVVENEVAAAADALHDVNTATADRLAAETRAKAHGAAIAAYEAAAAVRVPAP
jgi:hypothetical protein